MKNRASVKKTSVRPRTSVKKRPTAKTLGEYLKNNTKPKLLAYAQASIRELNEQQDAVVEDLERKLGVKSQFAKDWLFDYLFNKSISTKEMVEILNEEEPE